MQVEIVGKWFVFDVNNKQGVKSKRVAVWINRLEVDNNQIIEDKYNETTVKKLLVFVTKDKFIVR